MSGSDAPKPVLASISGAERKQMEQERLSRANAKKRQAEAHHDESTSENKRQKLSASGPSSSSAAAASASKKQDGSVKKRNDVITISDDGNEPAVTTSIALPILTKPSPPTSQGTLQPPIPGLQYPNGAFRKTWVYGHARQNDIKIEEVLQKNTLNIAVISSWQWDFDWFAEKFAPGKTKFYFVMEAKGEAAKNDLRQQFAGMNTVKLVFPPMSKSTYSRMHSKLMLLFHPNHLRIVVPTANPTKHDWGESGLLENSLFLIDLPRLDAKRQVEASQTPFLTSLLTFLTAQAFPAEIIDGIKKFDFSKTKNKAFIHSIPDTHEGQPTTGLASLSQAIRDLSLSRIGKIEVDFASSSLGSLDETQITCFTAALKGCDIWKVLEELEDKKKKKEKKVNDTLSVIERIGKKHADAEAAHKRAEGVVGVGPTGTDDTCSGPGKGPSEDEFRIIFPTRLAVENSKGGTKAAGTIFLKHNPNIRSSPPFFVTLLHNYESTRDKLLSHNKLILTQSSSAAHLYVGSANLSASAWGRVSLAAKSKTRKLTVSNWECGVLLPVTRDTGDVMKVLGTRLDLPFTVPARKYAEGDVPWMQ